MKTNLSALKVVGLLAFTSALGGVALLACSDSDNPSPADGGSTIDGGIIVIDTGTPKDATPGGDTAVTSDAAGDAGGDAAGGFVNGCWVGPATKSSEALNACTDGTCTPFNNVERLPLYNNGNLPAVP